MTDPEPRSSASGFRAVERASRPSRPLFSPIGIDYSSTLQTSSRMQMPHARSIVVAVLLSIPSIGTAQALPAAAPESVGMSAERLERIDDFLRMIVAEGEVAGAVGLVTRSGRVVARDSAGVFGLDDRRTLRTDAIFRIASMTKPVTSVAVMMLVEEGKVSLSDPVARFIPSFREMRVAVLDPARENIVRYEAARRQITIRDLLVHRAGLTYGFLDSGPVGDLYRAAGVSDGVGTANLSLAENIERVAAQPLVHHPGSAYQYGLSTDVLGRVVEVASGMPLDAFFRTRIFEPLGLRSTGFAVPPEEHGRIAHLHGRGEDDGGLRQTAGWTASSLLSGGAGLFSTADDYSRFLQMLLNGGELDGVRLLSPKTVELMTVSHTTDLAGDQGGSGRGFGLGFAVIEDLGATGLYGSVGSYNWGGIWGTVFWVDPVEELIAVAMIQLSGGAGRFQTGFRAAVYQAISESRPGDR
ncbi:MAG TPA: serine hydrolase domain-containing protein [Longimicrobiaceae bacterium]|nr:serine hydrolase domain-containing protein [Longimicrobiaceae bacterium]